MKLISKKNEIAVLPRNKVWSIVSVWYMAMPKLCSMKEAVGNRVNGRARLLERYVELEVKEQCRGEE